MSIPLFDTHTPVAPLLGAIEAKLHEVIAGSRFILGPEVSAFEDEFAAYVGAPHAIGVANGTDAITLALRAMGVGPGDEVVVPSFTFYASAEAIPSTGARPVFCDVDPETFCITAETVERVLTPATRAVIAVHLFGRVAPIDELRELLADRGVAILEDSAQAAGARLGDRRTGSLGDIATFSFFPSKNLGGFGDGGMIVTQDDTIAERLRRLRVHGGAKQYFHDEVGYNSRLDALQAAVLSAKLPHLAAWSAKRRENAAYYDAAFADLARQGKLATPYVAPENESIFNQYTLRIPGGRRDALQSFLKERGVGTSIYYPLPLHLQPCFAYLGYREGQCPESERAAKEVLSLPIFPELTRPQLDEVITGVQTFFSK